MIGPCPFLLPRLRADRTHDFHQQARAMAGNLIAPSFGISWVAAPAHRYGSIWLTRTRDLADVNHISGRRVWNTPYAAVLDEPQLKEVP